MDGIIIVDKPSGWTSFDVVAKIRSISHEKRVGHSGTLDPMATGLLPVFLGKATKFIKYFIGGDKGYLGEMILGVRTNTGDTEGERIPDYRKIRKRESEGQNIRIDKEEIEKVFQKYVGEMAQVPPMYSAVKVNGQRLYKLARKGITINREPRKVVIYKLKLIGSSFKGFETQSSIEHQASIDDTSIANDNRITFYVECSKGTYIRQLVMDIGDDLGCGACLAKLRRVYAHPFHISQAIDLETIITLAKIGKISTIIIQPQEILESMGVFSRGSIPSEKKN